MRIVIAMIWIFCLFACKPTRHSESQVVEIIAVTPIRYEHGFWSDDTHCTAQIKYKDGKVDSIWIGELHCFIKVGDLITMKDYHDDPDNPYWAPDWENPTKYAPERRSGNETDAH